MLRRILPDGYLLVHSAELQKACRFLQFLVLNNETLRSVLGDLVASKAIGVGVLDVRHNPYTSSNPAGLTSSVASLPIQGCGG